MKISRIQPSLMVFSLDNQDEIDAFYQIIALALTTIKPIDATLQKATDLIDYIILDDKLNGVTQPTVITQERV